MIKPWISITETGRVPNTGVPVLAFYVNKLGKGRIIRAQYAAPFTLEQALDSEGDCDYDETTDTYYCKEGWYETNEHEDIHWRVDETVTHWMPLPVGP